MRFSEIFEFISGKAHRRYVSEEAKRLYAKQLVSLSEKSFWLALAAFLPFFLKPSTVNVVMLAVASCAFIWVGLVFRHTGLKIIDEISTGKIEIITNK